ncbi:hypothetical protein J502_0726 [Acinetobacter sp. 1294596]|uniref:Uncharacterized protein n=1 Tax=Acinetobacter radioresistens SK82 TaxID=596318 RepID=A0ABP2GMP8_ACIRA|nr:hypothetical protein ACIRA0001_2800 [Acinetobacter radioresistens SK82]EJO37329.1 hypothetical protein ACINWCA157_1497 [Acinetobacter radioresistens WC-A-157]EXC33420.1 hypothetical protein J520_1020 [Acinetobacter sp. 869535]EXE13937.1 hypothetical protein J559_1860 [Acinetobacter sp. 983759]EXE60857.1 hypothetical protein J579_0179 [Acinetobacter sp. 1239920]EXF58035.1 hypothetical protein J502_0726 [Acinetobacter sp. 1294596]
MVLDVLLCIFFPEHIQLKILKGRLISLYIFYSTTLVGE